MDALETLERVRHEMASHGTSAALLQRLVALADGPPSPVSRQAEELLLEAARSYERALSPLYHVVPWSDRIIDDEHFARVFERTARLAGDFRDLSAAELTRILSAYPASLMVFRLVTGYTWAELSDIILAKLSYRVSVQKLQQIERAERREDVPGKLPDAVLENLGKAIAGVVEGTLMPLPDELAAAGFRTRQHKVDTTEGWSTVQACAAGGVSYRDLLYERYTGRPFSYVRDAMSERKGDILEDALEALLREHGVPFDRITDNQCPGFEQAPDFALPNRQEPEVVVESKLAEDGGTARDKASRIERLRHTCDERGILLVALVDGKGFRRFKDVLFPIIRTTRGHTYTLQTLDSLLAVDRVRRLASR